MKCRKREALPLTHVQVVSCQRVILANSEVTPTCSRQEGQAMGRSTLHKVGEEKALESEQSVRKAAGRGEMAGEFHLHWPAPASRYSVGSPRQLSPNQKKWEGSFNTHISESCPLLCFFILSSAVQRSWRLLFNCWFLCFKQG